MARVIKYKDGKKYIRDMKMGRSWRVQEKREGRDRMKKEGKGKEDGRPKSGGPPTEKRRFRPGTVALWEIRRFHRSMGFLI